MSSDAMVMSAIDKAWQNNNHLQRVDEGLQQNQFLHFAED